MGSLTPYPAAHSAWHRAQFGTGSNHTDPCDETVRPSRVSGRTWPLHVPTDTPNSSPTTGAPAAPGAGDGFDESETHDFYDWQTAVQSESGADTSRQRP